MKFKFKIKQKIANPMLGLVAKARWWLLKLDHYWRVMVSVRGLPNDKIVWTIEKLKQQGDFCRQYRISNKDRACRCKKVCQFIFSFWRLVHKIKTVSTSKCLHSKIGQEKQILVYIFTSLINQHRSNLSFLWLHIPSSLT